MTRPVKEIISSLIEGHRIETQLRNVEGRRDVDAGLLGADVVAISEEEFKNLPMDEQMALIEAGFGLGKFRESGNVVNPSGRVHGDAFYVVVTGSTLFGNIDYSPLYNYLTAAEIANVAAYNASQQLADITSGGGTAMASGPTLEQRIEMYGEVREINGLMHNVLANQYVSITDLPKLMDELNYFRVTIDGVDYWARPVSG
jgi:hypothetical protein